MSVFVLGKRKIITNYVEMGRRGRGGMEVKLNIKAAGNCWLVGILGDRQAIWGELVT